MAIWKIIIVSLPTSVCEGKVSKSLSCFTCFSHSDSLLHDHLEVASSLCLKQDNEENLVSQTLTCVSYLNRNCYFPHHFYSLMNKTRSHVG